MKRGHRPKFKPEASVVDAALDAMDAGALRDLVRGVLLWLDDKLHAKVSGEIIDRAARINGEWTPDSPSDESVAEGERSNEWDTNVDRWRREVTQRLEGADGLAAIARSTKRSDDFRAWCRALVEGKDWTGALVAYTESAESVEDKSYARGDLLDGAALAAQELGRKDLPKYLERAWRTEPSLLRLHRWLGSATSKQALKKRVAAATEACPKKEHGQLAFLHVLNGDMVSAAKLLAGAPGLGWSRSEHPSHLIFPLFCRMLGSTIQDLGLDTGYRGHRDFDELEMIGRDRDEPRLHSPTVEDVLALAGIDKVQDSSARTAMLNSMQKAAEKRLDGVTENKRRRYYGHAASLAAACMAVDETNNSSKWFAAIRDEYRRYPALQRELNRYGGGQ